MVCRWYRLMDILHLLVCGQLNKMVQPPTAGGEAALQEVADGEMAEAEGGVRDQAVAGAALARVEAGVVPIKLRGDGMYKENLLTTVFVL